MLHFKKQKKEELVGEEEIRRNKFLDIEVANFKVLHKLCFEDQ